MFEPILQTLVGNVEWAHALPAPGGATELVFRVDGQLRGMFIVPTAKLTVFSPMDYPRVLRAAGRAEVESRERGEKPVNLLTEAERDTLKLLLRGK